MRLIHGRELASFVSHSVRGARPANMFELDIHLGDNVWVESLVDPKCNDDYLHVLGMDSWERSMERRKIPASGYLLGPLGFCLTDTKEFFEMPPLVVGIMTLRSWAAKSGLEQLSSLTLKPGWKGHLILELFNCRSIRDLLLTPGLPVAQIQFFDISDDEGASQIWS